MTVLVLLALAGAFGDGPLSATTVRTPDGATITINRVMRAEMPEQVHLRGANGTDLRAIVVDDRTLRWLSLEGSVPRAGSETRTAGALRLELGTTGDAGAHVELTVMPHTVGRQRFRVQFGDGPWTDVGVVVLP